MSNALNHNIRAETGLRDLLDLGNGIVVQIDRLRAQLLRLLQSILHGINRDHRIHHRQRAGDGTDTHGSAADHDTRELLLISLGDTLQKARGGEVASGEDIRHKHQHLLGDLLGRLDERRVRERAPHILRLPAGDRVRRGAVAEQLALAASRSLPAHAEEALPARGVEGHDDFVADLEVLHVVALGHDLADELVSADEVRRAFQVAAVEVQVAAAEGGGGDFEDGIGGFLDLGDGTVFDDDLRGPLLD